MIIATKKVTYRYPCFCLCFGFEQIIYRRPLRFTSWHFAHIGLTDDLTFIFYTQSCLFEGRTGKSQCVLYLREES